MTSASVSKKHVAKASKQEILDRELYVPPCECFAAIFTLKWPNILVCRSVGQRCCSISSESERCKNPRFLWWRFKYSIRL